MLASVIIRTYNEQRYLPKLLQEIYNQVTEGLNYEIIIVDSGSTDATLEIAKAYNCKIVHICKQDFSFGRSLNFGCRAASGDYLVFVSGHCVPSNSAWLQNLVKPLIEQKVVLTYGCQIGGNITKFSEHQLFNKFYPKVSSIPQDGFFCNNANAALVRSVWENYPFDEQLTGLEDMHLGKQLINAGMKLGYVADSIVYHYHEEPWGKVCRRYEREAIALQHIMPEVHISFADFLRYFIKAVLLDSGIALQQRKFISKLPEIFMFRLMQFWGSYRGNHEHRKLSRQKKELYFYPKQNSTISLPKLVKKLSYVEPTATDCSTLTYESKQ